jgi:signal transduction histidine kinase
VDKLNAFWHNAALDVIGGLEVNVPGRHGSAVSGDAVAVVWSADDGQVVSATPAFADLVGRPPSELIGLPAAQLGLHVGAAAGGTVDDVEPWRVTSSQVELRTVSGTTRVVEARSHVMRVRGERLVFTVVEVAPQERGLLELVLDGVPLAIVLLDRELRIVRANTRAAAMLGVSETESVNRGFGEVLPMMTPMLGRDLEDILAGSAPRLGVELSLPPRRFLTSYFPLMAPNGAVNGVGCLFVDITEQRDAEDALHDSEENRRLIFGQMLRAEEAERARIALDLHDDTIQVLAASLMMTDGAIALAGRREEVEIATRLNQARDVLASATERARRLMFELYPTLLDQRGLRAALTALAEQIGQQIGATWSVDAPAVRYSWAVEALAFRIAREAATNVREHSQAGRFEIRLIERESRLYGVVTDDGRGFAVDQTMGASQRPLHLGLQSADERIHLAGGEFDVTSSMTPGSSGTKVSFWLPIDTNGT